MLITCLVYVSMATREMSDEDLIQLLKKARHKNEARGITGMLLYRNGFFMQALEGKEERVEKLFETIKNDSRHRHATLLYKHALTERAFPDWCMGFNKIEGDVPFAIEGYTDFLENPNPSYFINSPDKAKLILTTFKQNIFF